MYKCLCINPSMTLDSWMWRMPMNVARHLTGAWDIDTEDVSWGIERCCEHHACVSPLYLSLNHSCSLHTHTHTCTAAHLAAGCSHPHLLPSFGVNTWREFERCVCVSLHPRRSVCGVYTCPQGLLLFSPYSLLDCRGEMNHTVRCSENKQLRVRAPLTSSHTSAAEETSALNAALFLLHLHWWQVWTGPVCLMLCCVLAVWPENKRAE